MHRSAMTSPCALPEDTHFPFFYIYRAPQTLLSLSLRPLFLSGDKNEAECLVRFVVPGIEAASLVFCGCLLGNFAF
ncbi:hypothetical protein BT93_J0353 [Corymbia citriodora subsp. variegata]|nr:hypothetical protein BT93_J0353 [Corymbia citriodora subsp. variegata]